MESNKNIYDRLADEALRITADIIAAFGPRISGTEGNRSARAALGALLGERCSSVREEPFTIYPDSLFAIGKVFATVYLAGAVSLLADFKAGLFIGLFAMAAGAVFFVAQFILYLDTFDRLFKPAQASNIIGTIEPRLSATRQVLIVGHYDSAPVYPFYERAPLLFPIRLILPILFYGFCLAASAIGVLTPFSGGAGAAIPAWAKWVSALGLIFALPMFCYMSKRGSPGAGDDLIACAIGIKLAELFRDPECALERTRVVVLLTDGEEVGQKGAAAFVEENGVALHATDTTVINLDGIYGYEDLVLLRRDRNGFTELSADLAGDIQGAAAAFGHDIPIASIPFLGGGTDAGQFARKGLRTACIIAQPIEAFSREIINHTMKDMPDRISSKAVGAVIEIVGEYIKALDRARD
jgi:aminopeptidase YwaD